MFGLLCLTFACASTGSAPGGPPGAPDPAPAPSAGATAQRPGARLFIYPTAGQSAEQQDRDRYECYRWAVQQTGFDPSAAPRLPEDQVTLVPVPPRGVETLTGTVVGAAVGAGIGSISGHAGEGAAVGAVTGALAGAANEYAREQVVESIEAQEAERSEHLGQLSRYQRAMAACLEGRGYTVR